MFGFVMIKNVCKDNKKNGIINVRNTLVWLQFFLWDYYILSFAVFIPYF